MKKKKVEERVKREKKERNFLNYFQNMKILSLTDKHLPRVITLDILGCYYSFHDNLVEVLFLLLCRYWKNILSKSPEKTKE